MRRSIEKEKKLGINYRSKEEEILRVNRIFKFYIRSWRCGESMSWRRSKTIKTILSNSVKEP